MNHTSSLPSLSQQQSNAAIETSIQEIEMDYFRQFLHSAPAELFADVYMILSEGGIVQKVNVGCAILLGYLPQEMEGKSYSEFVVPDDVQKLKEFIERLRTNRSASHFVHQFLRKDENYCYVSWSSFWSEKESLIYCVGRDVTQLREAQKKQLASEQLLGAVIENSFDLLALIDQNGNYLYVSESVYKALDFKTDVLLGYTASSLVGTNCFAYMHPDDLTWLVPQFETLFKGEKKIQVPPYRFRDAQGNWRWLEAIVTNQLDHPDIRAIVVSCRDISDQVETNAKLKEMLMMEALIEGEEKERSRIARDLHDGVSGMIAAAKMQFASLAEKLKPAKDLKEFIQGMDLLEKAATQVRTTSHNLMPEILLENGLSEALRRYCCSISHDGFNIDYYSIGAVGRFSSSFELSLYRIAQELIGNVIRHAKAESAMVQLSNQQGILSLTIEDHGRGFLYDPSLKGTGLKSVKKRVETMNGHMEISSEPGKGTSIYLEFER